MTKNEMPEIIYCHTYKGGRFIYDPFKGTELATRYVRADLVAAPTTSDKAAALDIERAIRNARELLDYAENYGFNKERHVNGFCGWFSYEDLRVLIRAALQTNEPICGCGDSIPQRDLKCINCRWAEDKPADDQLVFDERLKREIVQATCDNDDWKDPFVQGIYAAVEYMAAHRSK